MSIEKQREIASKGGRAAHEKGTAHEWTADEARSVKVTNACDPSSEIGVELTHPRDSNTKTAIPTANVIAR